MPHRLFAETPDHRVIRKAPELRLSLIFGAGAGIAALPDSDIAVVESRATRQPPDPEESIWASGASHTDRLYRSAQAQREVVDESRYARECASTV